MRDKPIAKLVYRSRGYLTLPEELGTPRADQLQGTDAEKLTETAGRTCYDSFGQGRDSASYHDHILDVGHLSVLEHFHITIAATVPLEDLVGRPGITWRDGRITYNARCILDWEKFGLVTSTRSILAEHMCPHLPSYITDTKGYGGVEVEPMHPEEIFITFFMGGSRGFSHEMVRHRNNISQRSTRYVDESESNWVMHPLLAHYLKSTDSNLGDDIAYTEMQCKELYSNIVDEMQPWLISKGFDKLTARKQARGAARGYLGNALYTEMLFTASVAQWRRIIEQRMHPAADAEIRDIFEQHVYGWV